MPHPGQSLSVHVALMKLNHTSRSRDEKNTRRAGFEPTRGDPNGFLVHRLNRSAIAALTNGYV